jgi:NADP-dependent 3-hydroxy acid dehydrogenase YdfG
LVNYFLDKRIVITGASSGIGQAVSFWYLNQGANVILVGKDEVTLKRIASQFPTQATVVVTNITDDYQCKDLVEAVKNKFVEQDNMMKASKGMKTYDPKGEEEY